MRRTLLFAIGIAIFAFSANSQITKGSTFLGGQISANLNSYNYDAAGSPTSKTNLFSISPVVGKAIRNNLVIGGRLTYGHGKYNTVTPDEFETNMYGAAVFVRKYKQ